MGARGLPVRPLVEEPDRTEEPGTRLSKAADSTRQVRFPRSKMGKVILAAIVAAVVSALVTASVLASLQKGDRATVEDRVAATEKRVGEQKDDLSSALRRIDALQRRMDAAQRDPAGDAPDREGRAAPPPADAVPAAPEGPTAPDGTPWVSRADLEKALREHRTTVGDLVPAPAAPAKKSLEEIAREMGLSASEEASVRQIARESEEEAVKCLFGDRPLADVVTEFKAAKDDPDRMAELTQQTVTRAFSNVGKLMTLEQRRKKRVEEALGKERAKEFLAKPMKPVSEVDLDELLGDTFDD